VTYDPSKHHRRSIRLKDYDYTQPGAYSVNLCTQGRVCLFGKVVPGAFSTDTTRMILNDAGHLIQDCWHDLPRHYLHVELDAFVVMPNHAHGIIVLSDDDLPVGAGLRPALNPAPASDITPMRAGLPEIIRALKSFSARQINAMRNTPGAAIWQRDYYEHIIRNETELQAIREYIINNPTGWDRDPDNIHDPKGRVSDPPLRGRQ
jgi:putative transposase